VNTRSFADELTKLALGGGLLKKTLGLIARNPLRALGVGMIVAPTIMAAKGGYESGRQGAERPRYLSAGRDQSGKIRASDAAYTNYHELFPHKATPKEIAALSKNYNPDAFSRTIRSFPKVK
jgi:hypothetical protein